LQARLH